ncbi:unnamed protein product [Notodromas monacha]|uniref:Uncharacterized protein n=1 Tax=Notodromas monacha TaxID=399045 RepID=A0A7R9GDA7_9CRUS|nr:unnamed protein product [Notodromas monacha]CAG0918354.1 unnamed protein product [Notodromas monacha]
MSIVEKIAQIEAEMARTQRNKATAGHLGLLKARLAKLRRELITPKGGGGGTGEGFDVAKTGDARVGFVGFPSVGKSTLLSNLAGVYSEVAAYEFTTLTTVPGCIKYKGAKIQLLDLPGIIEGAKDGKGRGRQVIAVARTCSLIFIVLDVLKPLGHKKIIERELEGYGIRLNKDPPNIVYRRKDKGGINLQTIGTQSELDLDLVKSILSEYKIHNADITLRYDATADDLIDVIEGNRIYIPCIYLLNKIDQITVEELDIIYRIPHCVPISAHHRWNFDDLLEKLWDYLQLLRIYTKPKGQLPDYESPVVLQSGLRTVEHFCDKLHRTIMKEFKYALVWGSSVKHQPQKVGKDHVVMNCVRVKLRHFFVIARVKNVANRSLSSEADALLSPRQFTKDVLLFKYENPRYYKMLTIFGTSQFIFWSALSFFNWTSPSDEKQNEEVQVDDEFLEKLRENFLLKFASKFSDYRALSGLYFALGYGCLLVTWLMALRSVRMLVLRKGGMDVTFVTYAPFGSSRMVTVPLATVSCARHRGAFRSQMPVKVFGRMFHFTLDKRGSFVRPDLFDVTRIENMAEKPVCTFVKRKRLGGGMRKAKESSEGSSSDEKEPTVIRVERKRRENPLIQGTSGIRSKKKREKGESSDSDREDVGVSYKANFQAREGPSDMGATATFELDTAHDRDARATFERTRKLNEELKDAPDDKVYRGMSTYGQFKDIKDNAKGSAGNKLNSVGPIRAPQNVRATVRWDYQPDICKDYKETGFCGFGDSCKFLHDRSDYKHGWQIERELEEGRYGADDDDASRYEVASDNDDDFPFKCIICRGSFKHPVVTRCKHYFCEKCALERYKKSQRCFACGAQTSGVFNPAKKLIERLKNEPEQKSSDDDDDEDDVDEDAAVDQEEKS